MKTIKFELGLEQANLLRKHFTSDLRDAQDQLSIQVKKCQELEVLIDNLKEPEENKPQDTVIEEPQILEIPKLKKKVDKVKVVKTTKESKKNKTIVTGPPEKPKTNMEDITANFINKPIVMETIRNSSAKSVTASTVLNIIRTHYPMRTKILPEKDLKKRVSQILSLLGIDGKLKNSYINGSVGKRWEINELANA